MQRLDIRKIHIFVEEIHRELDKRLSAPLRRTAAAAVIHNPYAGRYSETLESLVEFGSILGDLLAERAVAALGVAPAEVQSYGKSALVGVAGELEHAAAILHPRFGKPFRKQVERGRAIIPSTAKRGGAGATLDVPLHNKDDEWSFGHFDTISVWVPDAPAPDEIVVVAAVSAGPRPLSRINRDS